MKADLEQTRKLLKEALAKVDALLDNAGGVHTNDSGGNGPPPPPPPNPNPGL